MKVYISLFGMLENEDWERKSVFYFHKLTVPNFPSHIWWKSTSWNGKKISCLIWPCSCSLPYMLSRHRSSSVVVIAFHPQPLPSPFNFCSLPIMLDCLCSPFALSVFLIFIFWFLVLIYDFYINFWFWFRFRFHFLISIWIWLLTMVLFSCFINFYFGLVMVM